MTTRAKTAASAISTLLFQSNRAIAGIEWLRGKEGHEWSARRNTTGRAAVSAILARAFVQAINGAIIEASCDSGIYYARVLSRSSSGKGRSCGMEERGKELVLSIPHGAPGIPVIGIYLGEHDVCVERMKELFLRLVVCQAEELPDKLGNLLRSSA